MKDLDLETETEAWLERARQGLSPREADQARVLAALEQRLDLPTPKHANNVSLPTPKPSFGLPVQWLLRTLLPLASLGAVGLYLATHSAPAAAPPPKRQPVKPVAAVVSAPPLELSDALRAVQEEPSPAPAFKPSEKATDKPEKKAPARKKCRAADGGERPCPSGKSASKTALASAEPAAAPSLNRELAALREAQRALRHGKAAEALAVLSAFEHDNPGPGAMQEERNAAATMARCALAQQPEASRELYDAFVQRYPKSAYAARLHRTCLDGGR
jgi:hypothetical protein